MRKIKWFFIGGIYFCLMLNLIYASARDNLREETLNNGLKVFLLEETSTPLVKITLNCKTDFYSQEADYSELLSLYSRLVQLANPQIVFSSIVCQKNVASFNLETTTCGIAEKIQELAQAIFESNFSEDFISSQLAEYEKNIQNQRDELSEFINSEIENKVTSQIKWNFDFNHEQKGNVINILKNPLYLPQNSALFVSGNIDSDYLLKVLNQTFGKYYLVGNFQNFAESEKKVGGENKLFILHHKNFSRDIIQMVVEYTEFDKTESHFLSSFIDSPDSFLKKKLLLQKNLSIPGDEYISANSVTDENNSRLIVQSILQKEKMVEQVSVFSTQFQNSISSFSIEEFSQAKENFMKNFQQNDFRPFELMEKIEEFWNENSFEKKQSVLQKYFDIPSEISQIGYDFLAEKIQNQKPYIFVLINSDDFQKNKNQFIKAGFEEISLGNKNQEKFQELDLHQTGENFKKIMLGREKIDSNQEDNDFFEKNFRLIQQEKLKNGISVITKENESSNTTTMLISIKGGKLNSSSNPGFEEAMVKMLTLNFQKELLNYFQNGLLNFNPQVECESNLASSFISFTCEKTDFAACCQAFCKALIFDDILPSVADRALSSVQYNHRISVGILENQLLSGLVHQLYPDSEISKVYTTEDKILQNVTYQKILEAHSLMLDSQKFSIILTGKIPENHLATLNDSFGLLAFLNNNQTSEIPKAVFPKQNQLKVNLVHKFFADPSADRNAPMPQILVPTTNFQDPVLFVLKCPDFSSSQYPLFWATVLYLKNLLQENLQNSLNFQNSFVSVNFPDIQLDFCTIGIQNVANKADAQSELDKIYQQTINSFFTEFQKDFAEFQKMSADFTEIQKEKSLDSITIHQNLINKIKENWIITQMKPTLSDLGTATLLQNPDSFFYLNSYDTIQKATTEDFLQLYEYFPATPILKVFSAN